MDERQRLRELGQGETIESICRREGWGEEEFSAWWRQTTVARLPAMVGEATAAVTARVEISRDRWGVPHIFADNDRDLFYGFGYAMAQDRLFQLDYLRRKARGRLSEVLGAEALGLDRIARTIGIPRIAEAEWDRLSDDVQQTLQSFAQGVNAVIEQSRDLPPIEFDLLDYQPEAWTPIDSLAIECEFRWYLTGRFPIIVMPELAKRALGEGPLLDEFLLGEEDDEPIVLPQEYPAAAALLADGSCVENVGRSMAGPDDAVGSNNWVIGGDRTNTGLPLLASDPHIAFGAVSCWYEAHLSGGSFNVAGMAYAGMPAIMFGRNEKLAWGITNNICSQRDLYQEKTDPQHPNCFQFDGQWEPAREVVEQIRVKGQDPVTLRVAHSRNGPIVDELLPSPGDRLGPVSLKWLGAFEGGWLTSLLDIDRATTTTGFREALRPWHVPTFSMVVATTDGDIGFHVSGRIPARRQEERGFRPGWDPAHGWRGMIPFEATPHIDNPPRGWVASANNRLAGEDYPFMLFGRWTSGWRAMRIRQMIESRDKHSLADMADMHQDTVSLRAANAVPMLLRLLADEQDPQVREAAERLGNWDFRVEPDSTATAIFNVFFSCWTNQIAAERFEPDAVALMSNAAAGCAARLLDDSVAWFQGKGAERAVAALKAALAELESRFGADQENWTWGSLHRMPMLHVLSGRGDLARLLDHGGQAVRGDMVTVCNTGSGAEWSAATGAGYRLIADLATDPPELRAIDGQSQSGNPGSPHYGDQWETWAAGEYRAISLDRDAARRDAKSVLNLTPGA